MLSLDLDRVDWVILIKRALTIYLGSSVKGQESTLHICSLSYKHSNSTEHLYVQMNSTSTVYSGRYLR